MPSPVRPLTSKGLGGTFLAFCRKPAAQDPALGRGERPSQLRPYSAWVSGPSCSSLGERRCHVPAGLLELGRWLHGRQRPGILGKGSGKGRRGPVGLCWTQACAKCRLPGQRENIRWGKESQSGVWVGSEVLAPRRRPPAAPPGHGKGIAEALSS